MKMSKSLVIAAIALSVSSFASAQLYVGVGAGQSNVTFSSDYSLKNSAVAESASSGNLGFKGLVGYELTPNFAIEASYAKLGNATYSYAATGITGQAEARLTSTAISLKGTLPVAHAWGVFAKVGVTDNQAEVAAGSDNTAFNTSMGYPHTFSYATRSTVAGVGAEYALNKASKIRMEYEDLGAFGGDNWSLSKTTLVSVSWTTKF